MNLSTLLTQTKQAVATAASLSDDTVCRILNAVAERINKHKEELLMANTADLKRMNTDNPKYDRLMLTSERLNNIAHDMKMVATLSSPLGQILQENTRPNGIKIARISVPFGVVGVIYEARPNVTFDIFSLCLKSGNVCILKGGSDAQHTNEAAVKLIHQVLQELNLCTHLVTLLPPQREYTELLLRANDLIDLLIPRGSASLIHFVREHATVPVIETGAGVCHTYFDSEGDIEKGRNIIHNAKTRRVSVCNALDCLLVHCKRLTDLPALCTPLANSRVTIFADSEAFHALQNFYPPELLKEADIYSYGTEFLDYKMAIRTVSSTEKALEHIQRYGSKHSECIITENPQTAELFVRQTDAACVYTNVSTAFTDGAQFGLGAEIGISTQKMHARGPMGLEALTTYKWVIKGNGQVRNN